MLINSEPRRRNAVAQVLVRQRDLPCLDHDSSIDTSMLIHLTETDIEAALAGNPVLGHKGALADATKAVIKVAVEGHGILPKLHKDLVLENL